MTSNPVVVVGGGPAGCFAALQAAKLDAEVTVLEEHEQAGVPSHCTGHISLTGLRRLGLQVPATAIENEVKSASFYSPSGNRLSVRFPSSVSLMINRQLFDQHLMEKAQEAGASIQCGSHVDSLLLKEGTIQGVRVRQNGESQRILAQVVIDAEGLPSTLLKRAGLPTANRRFILKGVQAEVHMFEDLEQDSVDVFLGHKIAPGFFAWIAPKADGTAKIGLGTAQGNPREYLHNFIHHHPVARRKLKRSRIIYEAYHPISLGGPISKTFHDGLLVVGDAASHVKPTTGGGIIIGLTCAGIAGEVAAEAVTEENPSAKALAEYERRWQNEIGFEMTMMRRLRLLLNNAADRTLDHLIAASARMGLNKTLVQVRDIDLQGTSLARAMRSPRLLATGVYFLIASLL